MMTATENEGAEPSRASSGNAAGADRHEPHGYLIGSLRHPTQITMYGINGGPNRWLRFPLDASIPPDSFVEQALNVARETHLFPLHGELTGVNQRGRGTPIRSPRKGLT